jgi:hypothetical protein
VDPYLRSTSSPTSSIETKGVSSVVRTNETTTVDSPPPIPPPPPPPPPHPPLSTSSSLSSVKSPSYRITVDDLHQSPLLHNLTGATTNDYRSSLYSTHLNSNSNSPISKLSQSRRESDINSLNKEQQQQSAPRIREISSNVGFVSLPDQVHRRSIKKGFEFNLMVIGNNLKC